MGKVISLSKHSDHKFSKTPVSSLKFIAGQGIEGDAHCGTTVKHHSRVEKDPTQPNLRQVHLIHEELIQLLRKQGFAVNPASLGENVTTSGIDLLSLPKNTMLLIGSQVQVRITGLRNPCYQLDRYQKGLTAAVVDRDEQGKLVRKAGVMGIVVVGGVVDVGDQINAVLPDKPFEFLECV